MPEIYQNKVKAKKALKRKSRNRGLVSNGHKNLTLENLNFAPLEKVRADIENKIGKMPAFPADLPEGIWSEQALRVLSERYLQKNKEGKVVETPEQMCWRVAWEVASAESMWGKSRRQVTEIAKSYFNLMATHEFLPNSPTLMNAGTGNNLQYSACFVLPVEDSIDGIFDAIKWQALIHKSGGGTGFAFSRLRPSGSMVKTSGGVASGPVSFMRIFDAATNEVKQGGKRRGANMGILRVDHPDIMEFIHCKEEGGITNFNISVAITDRFMEAYEADTNYELIDPKTKQPVGELSAREVFDEIAQGAWRTGDPGVIFLDRRNRGTSNPVPSLGPIEATNPCVTGDTLVSTESGLITIKQLYESSEKTKVLVDGRLSNASFQRPAKVVKTGRKQIYRLKTVEGYEVRLTLDHKVLTREGWVQAGRLKKGDLVFIANRKGGFGREGSLEEGEILGWLVGDGTMKAASAVLSFFGREKHELAPRFATMVDRLVDGKQLLNRAYPISSFEIPDRNEARVQSVRLWRYAMENGIEHGNKLKVPTRVFIGSREMQKGFLQALFTADGHVSGTAEKGISVRLTSVSESLLKDVQRLLLNFGIASCIYTARRREAMRFLPDGKGGQKEYLCREYHDLVISKENLEIFAREIGFLIEYKNAKLIDLLRQLIGRGPYQEKFTVRFDGLVKESIEEVYDLTEPATSSFIANGLVVHNCGEQELYPFDACNLGSIFLTYFVKDGQVDWEKLKEVTKLTTRFLDNVIEVNPFPLEPIRRTVLAIRRIGLGVGGWADMLVKLGIPYDSEEALELGEKIMKLIQETAVETSQELARERGPFPLFPVSIYKDETPRRNSTVTTIAPTGSISIIANASSGIEPLFAVAYQHIVRDKHLDRTLNFVNEDFKHLAIARGFWSEEIEKEVVNHGVVRGIAGMPEDVRRLFGTAHEMHHDWHIRMQAAFQRYTENAVSKTINMDNKVTADEIKEAYLLAWETDCKGVTVFRDGCKDAQVLNIGVKDKGREKSQESMANGEVTRERPFVVKGATYRLNTPVGTAFVTINENEEGEPLELFINVGKAGSDVAAMAEALGRTISTSLRFRGHLSPRERAREIAQQLSGIGGRRSVGFGPNKVLSLPDAISTALSSHFDFKINGNGHLTNGQSNLEVGANVAATAAMPDPSSAPAFLQQELTVRGDICPSCGASAFVYEEGCSKCYACGHSEC